MAVWKAPCGGVGPESFPNPMCSFATFANPTVFVGLVRWADEVLTK